MVMASSSGPLWRPPGPDHTGRYVPIRVITTSTPRTGSSRLERPFDVLDHHAVGILEEGHPEATERSPGEGDVRRVAGFDGTRLPRRFDGDARVGHGQRHAEQATVVRPAVGG